MYWGDEIASELVRRNPNKKCFLLAAGISPSGTVHIGNLRDIMTVFFTKKGLEAQGKEAKILFSWDAYDRFRKVPKNLPEERWQEFANYVGMPYSNLPNPYGNESTFAEHFEKEFEYALKETGIKIDFIRYQDKLYKSGIYFKYVKTAMEKRREIFDILQKFKTEEDDKEERDRYYPIAIYCDACKKDFTTIISYNEKTYECEYVCKCGNKHTINLSKQFNYKLAWKVDWPMRWLHEGVDFEPGGKDHASPQGSYSVSKIISKEIFGYNPPLFQGYEFLGMSGLTGKMSSSSGLNINLNELLKIYTPELILFIYARKAPREAFDVSFGQDVPRIYAEFDRFYNAYKEDKLADNFKTIIEYSTGGNKNIKTAPFGLLATFYSFANGNKEIIKDLFEKVGQKVTDEELEYRLPRVDYWLNKYSPESIIKIVDKADQTVYDNFTNIQKENIKKFVSLLEKGVNKNTIQQDLYDIPRDLNLTDKENKQKQLEFFKSIYKLALNAESGPALYVLVLAAGEEKLLKALKPLIK